MRAATQQETDMPNNNGSNHSMHTSATIKSYDELRRRESPNVFITNECPTVCATALCDQDVRSQVGETARILTTALHRHSINSHLLCKPDHINGRFARWAASDWNHFMWLSFHGMALVEEHHRRFEQIHSSSAKIIVAGQIGHLMCDGPPLLPVVWSMCPAARVIIENRDLDVFDAYEELLRSRYKSWAAQGSCPPKWTNTRPPSWLGDSTNPLLR